MSRATETQVLPALREYKRRAVDRLTPDALLASMALLKELNALVPGRSLLTASIEELNAAARQLMERGHTREELKTFNAELGIMGRKKQYTRFGLHDPGHIGGHYGKS